MCLDDFDCWKWKVFFFDIRKMTLPLCICNLVCKIISEIWGMRRFSKLP